jgi:hypothetical protein
MAPSSPQGHNVAPTGTIIHEPTFPNIGTSPDLDTGAELKLSPTDAASPASMSQQEIAPQSETQKSSPQVAPQKEEPTSSRPTQQRWATERPKASTKHSLLGRLQSGPRRKDSSTLFKPATVTFDPYSSETESDSSDSSDDEHMPSKSLSHDNTVANEENRKRKTSTAGPFSRLKLTNEQLSTKGRISKSDGRLKLSLLEKGGDQGYLAKALGAVLNKNTKNEDDLTGYDKRDIEAQKIAPEDDEMEHDPSRRVKLNIVIIIIGSRGDIQPFIRIGKILQNDYGHRVRMATHPSFKDFVEKDSGLEFFSIGGNPAELMAFMVKNPGLIPNLDTIKEGEIGRRRAQMYEMFQGMWRACINATDDETDKTNAKMSKSQQILNMARLTVPSGRQRSIHCGRHHCQSSKFCSSSHCREAGYPSSHDVHVRFAYPLPQIRTDFLASHTRQPCTSHILWRTSRLATSRPPTATSCRIPWLR